MVLVSDKPSNNIGILQTKLSDRERHETRRMGLEAMPLDQHVEGGHSECQTRLKIRPAPMHHLLHMALRHEVARLMVWHAVVTRPVVPSAVSYEDVRLRRESSMEECRKTSGIQVPDEPLGLSFIDHSMG